MNSAFQPQVILLREDTPTSQGKANTVSNVNASQRRNDSAFQPQNILLREDTAMSLGKAQITSKVNASQAIAEIVKTVLGPKGIDKLIFDGQRSTFANDAEMFMRLPDIAHHKGEIGDK